MLNIEKDYLETNKAFLIFDNKNNLVFKKFKKAYRNKKEYEKMVFLHSLFKQIKHKGWIYKTVKPINYDNKQIIMEKAKGKMLKEFVLEEPELLFYAGIWLGLFHKETLKGKTIILIGDFSLTNVLVDKNTNEICAIDPGGIFGRNKLPEIDITLMILDLESYLIKRFKNPAKSINYFLNGYISVCDITLNINNFQKACDFWINHYKKKEIKKKANLNYKFYRLLRLCILRLYFIFIVKIIIKRIFSRKLKD